MRACRPRQEEAMSRSPDRVTRAACTWLLDGGRKGAYRGPDPGDAHDLSPLLAGETGRPRLRLLASGQWLRRRQLVRPVLRRLDDLGGRVWAIKGFDLAESVYPSPGGRLMCDVDLLVESDMVAAARSCFPSGEWVRGTPGDGVFSAGIVSEMKYLRWNTMVELHTHIFYFPATFPGRLPGDLFEGGREIAPALRGLAWHNALLIVLLHMLCHTVLRPAWWVDAVLLCNRVFEAGFWHDFCRGAAMTALGRELAGLLDTAADLGAPVPARVTAALRNAPLQRGGILRTLRRGRGWPTLANLAHLRGWRRLSWLYPMLWLALTGGRPIRFRRGRHAPANPPRKSSRPAESQQAPSRRRGRPRRGAP